MERLRGDLMALPAFDAHTHLVGGHLGARGLHDVLLYHMAISDLYAAGCPCGARLTQYPGWPDRGEAEKRIIEALPYLEYVRNTSTSWGVRLILSDLYDWNETITLDNWRKLDDRIRERADDGAWQHEILRRAGIAGACTEIARREQGQDDSFFCYSLEWAFFTRCQWGEFDTALYELERCWGQEPGPPSPIGGTRPVPARVIRSVEDAHEALQWYLDHIPNNVASVATHLSTDIDYRLVSPDRMAEAIAQRDTAGPFERDIYASFIHEAFLAGLERQHGNRVLFQFSLAAEPLPYETSSRIEQRTIAQLGEMIGRHPGLRFQCYNASAHADQSLCTLCRELPNFSLSGYWWHNFFPSLMERVMAERLDMLPLNKQVGFFSDAYCAEWAYAKSKIIRHVLARVLADKVELGQYTTNDAVAIASKILRDTGRELLGML